MPWRPLQFGGRQRRCEFRHRNNPSTVSIGQKSKSGVRSTVRGTALTVFHVMSTLLRVDERLSTPNR
jgi:hypothetical protein